jgi:hypothetical protein
LVTSTAAQADVASVAANATQIVTIKSTLSDGISCTTAAVFPAPLAAALADAQVGISGFTTVDAANIMTVVGTVSVPGLANFQVNWTGSATLSDTIEFVGTLSASASAALTTSDAIAAFATAAIASVADNRSTSIVQLTGKRSLSIQLLGSRTLTIRLSGNLIH